MEEARLPLWHQPAFVGHVTLQLRLLDSEEQAAVDEAEIPPADLPWHRNLFPSVWSQEVLPLKAPQVELGRVVAAQEAELPIDSPWHQNLSLLVLNLRPAEAAVVVAAVAVAAAQVPASAAVEQELGHEMPYGQSLSRL
jgi:hypothetical protein